LTERPDLAKETPLAALLQRLTPNDVFFVRSHGSVTPHADRAAYRLEIAAPRSACALTLGDLRALPRASEIVTLACSGNGRRAFDPLPAGLRWGFGAIATARWDGVRLRDVLAQLGPLPRGARDVVFDALDPAPDAQRPPYRRSMPIARALADATIVADTMNGEPIPDEHGGPVRLVAGGWTGNHAVKWLRRVTLAGEPDRGHWMENDYRLPGPSGASEMIEAAAPIAIIASPSDGARVPARLIASPSDGARVAARARIEGVAYGTPAPQRVRVEIDGAHVGDAPVRYEDGPYAWGRWSFDAPLGPGPHRIAVRPANGDGTPYEPTPWNAGGYLYSGPHEIAVNG
jgi:sulfite oxidase